MSVSVSVVGDCCVDNQPLIANYSVDWMNMDFTLFRIDVKNATGAQLENSRDKTLTLTLILLHQPETTATFGNILRLCHSNYDLATPTRIRSGHINTERDSRSRSRSRYLYSTSLPPDLAANS